MKKYNTLHSRKFRYGSVAVAMTALIVAAILLINAGISALSGKYGLYLDLTDKGMYTLTDAASELLAKSLEDTRAERKTENENLPATNLSIAEDNIKRMQSSVELAKTNLDRANKNISLAERNRELLAKSTVVAEDNLEIAEDNLKLARELYEAVAKKEGESAENTAAAADILATAEKNVTAAEANIVTAAANRGKQGYTPLATLEQLPVLAGYKYLCTFDSYINDDDSATAEKNKQIAERNSQIAAQNLSIAEKNKNTAGTNSTGGLVPGATGYTAPDAYAEYEKFDEFTTYKYLGDAETPRSYEPYITAEPEKQLAEDVKVRILFCNDRDAVYENTAHRYVLETAEDLERAFPDIIKVEFVNIWTNPGAVQKYKGTALSNIYSTNVIIESGTEFRVYSLTKFFLFNDAQYTDAWSYNGEKVFATAILAVVKAESPIACVTINHGEAFADTELFSLLEDAGFVVQALDLATEEIPEDCRLMIVSNPSSDFLIKDGVSDISEIAKLDSWLNEFNSLVVFMSPDGPVLPNFEEYLEEWGIEYARYTNSETGEVFSEVVKDTTQSLTADGMTVIGEYVTTGLGGAIHTDMRTVSYPAKVIFKNVMPIKYADNYSVVTNEPDAEEGDEIYRYGNYWSNGISRSIYDVFTSSEHAVTVANGEQVAAASSADPFKLMTITRETQMTTNDDADYSNVIACGSIDFISAEMLQSLVYGNSEILTSSLRQIARETIVVDLAHKPFDVTDIESLTTAEANRYTVVLSVIPALAALVLGVYVVVRRKYA